MAFGVTTVHQCVQAMDLSNCHCHLFLSLEALVSDSLEAGLLSVGGAGTRSEGADDCDSPFNLSSMSLQSIPRRPSLWIDGFVFMLSEHPGLCSVMVSHVMSKCP